VAGITGAPSAAEGANAVTLRRAHRTRLGFRLAHVRTLLWLAWKLRVRGFTRNWQQIVGVAVAAVFLAPFIIGVSAATAFGYVLLDRAAAAQLLFAVLVLLYIIWAVLPLFQYTVNEGLDVTKLQSYPVTRGEQMITLVLATLFDISVFVLLCFFAAIVIGWHATPLATVITVVALGLAYIHIVTLSQLLLAALMGMLRSRRYRDISIIVFTLVGALCSISFQIGARALSFTDPTQLASLPIESYTWWTPPGMAATAIIRADSGDYLTAVGWLVALIVIVPVLLFVWGRVLDRGITTAETAGVARGRSRRAAREAARERREASAGAVAGSGAAQAAARRAVVAPRRRRLLPEPVSAIAGKDLRYYWRDPQLKASMLSSLMVLVFIFLPRFLYGAPDASGTPGFGSGGFFTPSQVYFAPLPALLITLNFSLNAFGLERQGAQTLFLFPVRPLDVFWGKNLAVGVISAIAGLVTTLGLAALTGGWSYVPIALAGGLAALFVLLGCGNVVSVLMPFRVRQLRMGENRVSTDNGCLRSVLSMVVLGVVALLLVPVLAAAFIPQLVGQSEWLWVTLPAGVVYGILLHQLTTRLIAPQFHRRAPEILAVVARDV
jgi:ABC-2 type transport system permease protein